jgi:hypothetical protein
MRASVADLMASQPAKRRHLPVREALRRVGGPRGINAIHLADHGVGAEAVDDGDIVGDPLRVELAQQRELGAAVFGQPPPQRRGASLDDTIKRTLLPAGQRLAGIGGLIFARDRFALGKLPSVQAAAINRMQGIDEHLRARHRQAVRDDARAELRDHRGFILAAQPGIADPCGQLGKLRVVHFLPRL